MMKVASLCFQVCYPQQNALSVKKPKRKQAKSAMCHNIFAIFMKFHKAKDCGIPFVLLLTVSGFFRAIVVSWANKYEKRGFHFVLTIHKCIPMAVFMLETLKSSRRI